MRLLDKYILKAFVGPFLFGVFAFTSIFYWYRHINLELLNTLLNMGTIIACYESLCLGLTKYCYLNIPYVSTLGISYDL